MQEIIRYSAGSGGVTPVFVIIDAEAMLRLKVEFEEFAIYGSPGAVSERSHYWVMGCMIVAMPTDGIPMMRAVDYPYAEALRTTLNAERSERSEASE